MEQCWNADPKRPTAGNIWSELREIMSNERKNPTYLGESSDIGPIAMNNPGAIYKSRPLSGMISSAMSTISLRSQTISLDSLIFGNNLFINIIIIFL